MAGVTDDDSARLRLARLAVGGTQADPAMASPGWVPGPPEAAVPGEPAGTGLRDRALASAVATYTATHGHPLGQDLFALPGHGPPEGRRWATPVRAAVVGAAAVALLAGAVVLRSVDRLPSTVVSPVVGSGAASAAPTGAATGPAPPATAEAGEIVVHVVGQVAVPGIVRLPIGARVTDAIEAAGGATGAADLAAVNLARVLTDGEQVLVPRPGEHPTAAGPVTPGGEVRVDLNTADVAALDALPGIGPVIAQRIVDWRTEHGSFTSVEELGEVSGIGPAVLADLHDRVRVP